MYNETQPDSRAAPTISTDQYQNIIGYLFVYRISNINIILARNINIYLKYH